jgi:hypothetical protein
MYLEELKKERCFSKKFGSFLISSALKTFDAWGIPVFGG